MKNNQPNSQSPLTEHFKALSKDDWLTTHFGSSPAPFIKGLELSEIFFREQVEPIVRKHFPNLQIAAGRIDYGSDVLGYDTEISRDHAWGPQVTLFLTDSDLKTHKAAVSAKLQDELPLECRGYPTRMTQDLIWHPTPDGSGYHRVRIESLQSFFSQELGFLPGNSMPHYDWLSIPAQKLRVYASGKIFVDDLKEASTLQETLRWYPRDIGLHVMACQWHKLLYGAPFAGRSAHVGDMWGAAFNSQQTIDNLVRIAHLLEQRYPPYNKWLGSSLKELTIGEQLIDISERVRLATTWPDMENAVLDAYQLVANHHNSIHKLPTINSQPITFHSRPYRMIDIESIVNALKESIADKTIRELPLTACAIWQFSDYDPALCSTDASPSYKRMIQETL